MILYVRKLNWCAPSCIQSIESVCLIELLNYHYEKQIIWFGKGTLRYHKELVYNFACIVCACVCLLCFISLISIFYFLSEAKFTTILRACLIPRTIYYHIGSKSQTLWWIQYLPLFGCQFSVVCWLINLKVLWIFKDRLAQFLKIELAFAHLKTKSNTINNQIFTLRKNKHFPYLN